MIFLSVRYLLNLSKDLYLCVNFFYIKAVVVIVLLMGSVVISLTSSMYVQSGVTVMMILCM